MDYTVPTWVGWSSIALWLGIYFPLSLYGIHLFYKYRFVSAIAKRHVTMTLIVLSLCLSHICIDRVLWTLYYICNISANSIILNISTTLTYPIILYGLVYSLLWRFWIIRYDIQFVRASMNNKWRSVINCEYLAKNWYLINRSKWGNTKFIAMYIILPLYAISVAISILIRLQVYAATESYYVHLWSMDIIMVAIPYSFIIYLWFNTPSFHDTFWIHNATKYIFIVLFILFATNVTFSVLCLCLQFEYELLTLIESHIICMVHFCIIIVMTFMVFYKNKVSLSPLLQLQAFVAAQNQSNNVNPPLQLTATNSLPTPHHKSAAKHKRISLTQLLEDSIMFHTFMSHLAHEFSMECLLAIVEFTEYTEYCINNFNDYLSTKHDYRRELVKLPPDIPKSLIVYGSKTDKNHDSEHDAKGINVVFQKHIPPMIQNIFSKTPPPPLADTHSNKKDPSPQPSRIHTTTLHITPESKPIDHILITVDNALPVLTLTNTSSQKSDVCKLPSIPIPIQIHRNSSDSLHVQRSHSNSHSHSHSHHRRKSKGVYGDLKPFQTKAKLLYEKYIEEGAHYEINISGELRKSFNVMLNDDELWNSVFDGNKNRNKLQNEKIISEKLHEILALLNKSIQEMIKLLSHSYARFKQTDTYDKLLRILK